MSEVVVIGSFTTQAGKEQEAAAALQSIVAPSHDDDGCILYALHRGIEDPRRFAFIERWESAEQLRAHMGSGHIQAALAKLPELFEGAPEIVVYEAMPSGERVKGSLAGHAAG